MCSYVAVVFVSVCWQSKLVPSIFFLKWLSHFGTNASKYGGCIGCKKGGRAWKDKLCDSQKADWQEGPKV